MNQIHDRSGIRAVGTPLRICHAFGRVLFALFLTVTFSQVYGQVPTITGVSPLSGPIGTTVTITGSNFSTTPANNIVFFGAVKATVATASASVLEVIVPSGATEQPISVSVNGLMVASHFVFQVTFTGGSVLMGNPVLVTSGSFLGPVAIADVDGDGKPDLLTVSEGNNAVCIHRNVSGSGTITPTSFADKVELPTAVGPRDFVVGDVDGDGKPDVVAGSMNVASISVMKNTSSPGVVSFAERIHIPRFPFSGGLALGDLDGDGRPELVSIGTGAIYIHKNLAPVGTIDNTTFSTYTEFAFDGGGYPQSVRVDDVDNDGKHDLIIGTMVMRNTSTSGSFSFAPKVTIAEGTSAGGNVTLTDLDGDGLRELILPGVSTSVFYVARNISTTGLQVEFEPYFTVVTGGFEISSITAGDVDGDSKPDVVIASSMNRILIFKNQASPGSLDRLSLADQPAQFVLDLPSTGAKGVAVGDLNGDNKPDILASAVLGSNLMVLQNGVNPTPTVPQTISFDPISSPKPYGTVFDLVGTASSGLDVTFTSNNPSVITVAGSSGTVVGIGSATITARQNGNIVYLPATPKNRTVATVKANQMISWGDAFSPKTVGDPDFTFTSSTPSNLPLTFTSSNTDVATISGKILHIVGAGTSVITVSQAGNEYYNAAESKTLELVVFKGDQSITFEEIPIKLAEGADFALNATASSGLTVSYTSSDPDVATVTGNVVDIIGAGTTTITAVQEGNVNYNAAPSKTQVLTVEKIDQIITFWEIAPKFVDDADFTLEVMTSSGLPLSFSSSNTDVATVTGDLVHIVGAGTTTITASQEGNTNYHAAAPETQILTVTKREQTITFEAIAVKTMGDPDFTISANASSGLPVSYNSSNILVATVSGNLVHITGAGTSTITASQGGNTVFDAASPVAHTLTVEALILGTETDTSGEITIYPNPTTDRITILSNRFNQHSVIEVTLVDVYGRLVVQKSFRTYSDKTLDLSMSSLDDGLYIVHVKQGGLEFRNRIIKIR